MNTTRPGLDEVPVRQALAHAVPEAAVERLEENGYVVTDDGMFRADE